MRYTKAKSKISDNDTIYTNFMIEISEWFDDRIKLEKSRRKGKQKTSFNNEIKKSGARKKDMLDKMIFPSLFNLMIFFECIQKDPHMKKLFQKDFIKFVGMDGMQDIKRSKSMSDQLHSFRYKNNNFSRLVLSMINSVMPKFVQNDKILYAFLYQLQDIIGRNASMLIMEQFGIKSHFAIDATNTFLKSIDLLAAMTTGYDDNLDYGDLNKWVADKKS